MGKLKSKLLVIILIITGVAAILKITPNPVNSSRYTVTEKIIIEDYWPENTLKLTRVTESNEEGTAV